MYAQYRRSKPSRRFLATILVAWPLLVPASGASAAPADASVAELMSRDLISGPEKEVVMLTVTYPAAGSSLPHRHDAQVFVYVLEGELTMQVRGGQPVTLGAGQTFYEAPADIHVVSANRSTSAPAKILVVMIKDKGKPASRPATD
jgi:quercetin dioxygenase-like cupin family protein